MTATGDTGGTPLRRAWPFILLVGAPAIWALFYSASKVAAEAGIPSFVFSFWQSIGGGLLLLVICLALRIPPGTGWRHLRAYAVIGALAVGFPLTLLNFVAPHLNAGLMTLVLSFAPALTYLFGVIARLERIYLFGVLGILLGFAWVSLVLVPETALPDPDMAGWFLLALGTPCFFAMASIAAAILQPPAEPSPTSAGGTLLGSTVVMLVFVVATGRTPDLLPAWTVAPWALLAAAVLTAFFISVFLELVRLKGPVFFSQANYLITLYGFFWGWVIWGEAVSWWIWLAFALVVAGIILASFRRPLDKAVRG